MTTEPKVRYGAHPRVAWLLGTVLVKPLVRLEVRGSAQRPSGQPVVLVANHRSWIDPLVILCALGPQRMAFVAAREHVEKRGWLERLIRWLGAGVLVEREAIDQRAFLRSAHDVLTSGAALALFGEGRINTSDTTLLPFQAGAAFAARRAGVALQPVAIAGTRQLHLRRRVVLVWGEPLPAGATPRDDAATTLAVHAALSDLLPPDPPLGRWQPWRFMRNLA